MLSADQVRQVIGTTAYGSDGGKIGKVGQVYYDAATEQPEWVTVNTGLFGTNESFVPVADATFDGERLTVAHIKDKVKEAPNVGSEGRLTEEEERTLYDYYNRDWEDYLDNTGVAPTGTSGGHVDETPAPPADPAAAQTSAPATPTEGVDIAGHTTDDAMTRSEERLQVGVREQATGKARLRKWVETEYVNVTVPVRREKAALETESTGEGSTGRSLAGEGQQEVVLSEERPVVSTTVHPVQKARISTETVTEQETTTADLRKERVEVEEDRHQGGQPPA